MLLNTELFQVIQNVLPKVFAKNPNPLNMREARPLIMQAVKEVNDLQGRFSDQELRREAYRHIRQSCINIRDKAKAYQGAKKILWNDVKRRTYRLLTTAELRDIASGRLPISLHGANPIEQNLSKAAQYFAKEHLLRDHLVKNLEVVEAGLRLWKQYPPSKEFPIANRLIDILAVDNTGCPVILELKLHRGHERVLGQVLLYRALLRKYLSFSRVRIVLVAEHISKDLEFAAEELNDVQLFEYASSNQILDDFPSLKLVLKATTIKDRKLNAQSRPTEN